MGENMAIRFRTGLCIIMFSAVTGCGDVGAPDWLSADGRWGWGDSAESACAAALHVRIQGDRIEWFDGDKRVRQGRKLERSNNNRGAVSTGAGKLERVTWRYTAQRLDDPGKLAYYHDEFTVRWRLGSVTHLVLERRLRRVGPGAPLQPLAGDYPGRHQNWYHCTGANTAKPAPA